MAATHFAIERVQKKREIDSVFLALVIVLTGVGLVTLFSASSGFAERFFDNRYHFIAKQLRFAALGVVALALGIWIDVEWLRRLVMPLVILTLVLCLLPLVPGLGLTTNGATRWVRLGPLSFQPSELAKLVLPLYLAHILAKKGDRLGDAASGVLPPAIITLAICTVVYLQKDFSTAVFIAATALVVFFLAGVRLRHFVALFTVAIPLSFLLIFTEEFRVQRLITFLNPDHDLLNEGYQVRSSILTVASGGFWGKGIGQGTRKIASVPEIHSDFVFAAFAEEAGYIGVLAYFLLLGFFTWRILRMSWNCGDTFKRLLSLALLFSLVAQSLLNVAVVAGFLPATGIPLPFFSAGGTALVATLFVCGLLVNLTRRESGQEATNV